MEHSKQSVVPPRASQCSATIKERLAARVEKSYSSEEVCELIPKGATRAISESDEPIASSTQLPSEKVDSTQLTNEQADNTRSPNLTKAVEAAINALADKVTPALPANSSDFLGRKSPPLILPRTNSELSFSDDDLVGVALRTTQTTHSKEADKTQGTKSGKGNLILRVLPTRACR